MKQLLGTCRNGRHSALLLRDSGALCLSIVGENTVCITIAISILSMLMATSVVQSFCGPDVHKFTTDKLIGC